MLSISILPSPVIAPTPAVRTGPTMGAMTIDPTTMAGESPSSPPAAMIADKKTIHMNEYQSRAMSRAFDRSIVVASGENVLEYRSSSVSIDGVVAVSALPTTVYASSARPASWSCSNTSSTASVGTGNSTSVPPSPDCAAVAT